MSLKGIVFIQYNLGFWFLWITLRRLVLKSIFFQYKMSFWPVFLEKGKAVRDAVQLRLLWVTAKMMKVHIYPHKFACFPTKKQVILMRTSARGFSLEASFWIAVYIVLIIKEVIVRKWQMCICYSAYGGGLGYWISFVGPPLKLQISGLVLASRPASNVVVLLMHVAVVVHFVFVLIGLLLSASTAYSQHVRIHSTHDHQPLRIRSCHQHQVERQVLCIFMKLRESCLRRFSPCATSLREVNSYL